MTFVDQSRLRARKEASDAPATPPKPKVDPARKTISAPAPAVGQHKLRESYRRKGKHLAEQFGLPLEGSR